ncbi:DUF1642 domain-containing protein [Lactococcus garvieae]|nr:DUF1642 domain-containing protein [Lactococcus garvieae]USI71057.1 DUF1642 domain-containing protein [Lactococcus garvieae subsp. garvieae]
MKKFEEELNNGLVSIGQDIITKEYAYGKDALINYFKDWVSPEDHQAEIDQRKQQYEEHQEIYSKTAKKLNEAELELSKLKSQLEKQQPEIPEVPQFVADWYEKNKNELEYGIWNYIRCWNNQEKDDFYNFMNGFKSIETIFAMKNGYTVKEKRFYLKNKLTGFYLYKAFGGKYGEESVRYGTEDFGEDYQFTQQEIDSMAADSYEKIEVVE